MNGWSKTNTVNLILVGVIIVGLLTAGAVSIFWTYPNDQGAITNAALQGKNMWVLGNYTCCCCYYRNTGPQIVSVKPSSEARYIVEFNQTNVSSSYPRDHSFSSPDGLTFVLANLWTSPSTTFSSFEQRYVAFVYSFQAEYGPGAARSTVWFTGPQGNLSQTVQTSKYAGADPFTGGIYGTSIIEAASPGNYTLHFINPSPVGSLNGTVVMGPSSVTFTRPYVYAGTIAILAGAIVAVITSLILIRKLRKAKAVQTTKPSYMSLEK